MRRTYILAAVGLFVLFGLCSIVAADNLDVLSSIRLPHERWVPWVAGIGLVVWVSASIVERRTGRRRQGFTYLLVVLAAIAGLGQEANQLSRAVTGQYVRAWNVFHYYVGSKYFPELGYFDLYGATLAADDDWQATKREASPEEQQRLDEIKDFSHIKRARDMRDYKVKSREEVVEAFDRSIISEERLKQLGEDTRFLRRYLGSDGWTRVLHDLGYNPAPPWTIIGTSVSNLVPARFPFFWLISNSDLPIYVISFLLAWKAFGVRATAAATLWICTIQFNNGRFSGGFLQYDWLASCVACLALYKMGRYRSAGIALGWGAMTRVFPGFLIFPIVIKLGIDLIRGRVQETEQESSGAATGGWFRTLRRRAKPRHLQFLMAFTLASGGLFVGSHFTGRGLNTWPEWVEKIGRHSYKHAITSNQRVGVGRLAIHHPTAKNFWAEEPGDGDTRLRNSSGRKWLLRAFGLALLVPALIRRRDEDAIILSLFLVLIGVSLSRYYASIFVLMFVLGISARHRPEFRPEPCSGQNPSDGTSASLAGADAMGWSGIFSGAVLLAAAATFYLPKGITASYFLVNYELYLLFCVLCVVYLVYDIRAGRADAGRGAEGRGESSAIDMGQQDGVEGALAQT